jgi:hypothetical protein
MMRSLYQKRTLYRNCSFKQPSSNPEVIQIFDCCDSGLPDCEAGRNELEIPKVTLVNKTIYSEPLVPAKQSPFYRRIYRSMIRHSSCLSLYLTLSIIDQLTAPPTYQGLPSIYQRKYVAYLSGVTSYIEDLDGFTKMRIWSTA